MAPPKVLHPGGLQEVRSKRYPFGGSQKACSYFFPFLSCPDYPLGKQGHAKTIHKINGPPIASLIEAVAQYHYLSD